MSTEPEPNPFQVSLAELPDPLWVANRFMTLGLPGSGPDGIGLWAPTGPGGATQKVGTAIGFLMLYATWEEAVTDNPPDVCIQALHQKDIYKKREES